MDLNESLEANLHFQASRHLHPPLPVDVVCRRQISCGGRAYSFEVNSEVWHRFHTRPEDSDQTNELVARPLKSRAVVLLQDNAAIRHALAAAGGQCVLPRKKRRTYGFLRGPDGSFRRVAREAEDEFAGTYEEFLEKATAAAKRGMKLGREDFERLNPEGVAFLKLRSRTRSVNLPG